MKIYEKPMAKIEKLNIEDVITTSPVEADKTAYADAYTALKSAGGSDTSAAIIFEW